MVKGFKVYMRSISILLASCIFLTACGSKQEVEKEPVEISDIISQTEDSLENTVSTETTTPTDISLESEEINKEDEIIKYFENLKDEVYAYANSEDINELKNNVKDAIIDGIDFIFYGKEINGITFEELNEGTKNEIKCIVAEMDSIIEKRKPGYKEELKSSFGRFSDVAKANVSNIDEALENALGESYNDFKEFAGATGDVIGNVAEVTGELVEQGAESGFTFIKEWYEEKTGKR